MENPANKFRPILICFDIDGTIIKDNSWFKLNTALGITVAEDKEMYDQYGRGELSYEDWTHRLEELYLNRGLATEDFIKKVLTEYELISDAMEVIDYLKSAGYKIALITGGFAKTAEHLASELGIEHYKANTRMEFDDDGKLTALISAGDENKMKPKHLAEICEKLSIKITDCAVVGDGGNDLELFKATGHGVTFTDSSEGMKQDAEHVVTTLSDLKNIF